MYHLIATSLVAIAQASVPITVDRLISDMTSLDRLTRFPHPPYITRQASSYDRAAKSPTENWFANGDAGQYIRSEKVGDREEWVMMDAAGPGVIVRIWSANPAGTVRFYLDNSDKPTIEMKLADLLSGKTEPFLDPIAHVRSSGWNLYFPIPYSRHCKVTLSEDPAVRHVYYHINYRTYPSGTLVRSFTMAQAEEAVAKHDLAKELMEPRQAVSALGSPSPIAVTIEPGRSATIFEAKGPADITGFVLRCEAEDVAKALRGCVLTGVFDGKETIWAPVGDFFGTAPGINPFDAVPLQVNENGEMICRWIMPFQQGARLRISNNTEKPVRFQGRAAVQPRKADPSRLLFHAKWRTEKMPTRPMRDWNYLTATGRGIFVGNSLHVTNPVSPWWGEGDEKIYIDGETFPSTFGTGTEDYYGYAWCNPTPFFHLYHNQPRCDGPGNKGHTLVNRFHILDDYPFNTSFRFDMEVWHSQQTQVDYAVTVYWYATKESTDGFQPASVHDLVIQPVPERIRVPGAIEGENLRVVECTGGIHERQGMADVASNDAHLWWRDGKPGDRLKLAFEAPGSAPFSIVGNFCKAADYGIIQFYVNGQKVGGPVDFYNDGIVYEKRVIGVVDLKRGENILEAEIVGANEKTIKRYMMGLDYIVVELVP
ncbi:MAG: DUF2961 domain-containing protein [Fimbriimonadia bacterium]